MTPPMHRSLWRAEFAAVPPVERRLARYALQLFRHDPQRALNLSDHEVLGALWRLTAPLLDPRAARELMGCSEEEVPWAGEALEPETLSGEEVVRDLEAAFARDRNEPARPAPVVERRQRCRAVFETLPQQIVRRLTEADGVAPTSSTVATLGQALGLSATEILILDYLEHRELSRPLRVLLRAEPGARYATRAVGRLNLVRLAAMLGVEPEAVRGALARQAPLQSLELVECDSGLQRDLEDFLSPTNLLRRVLEAAPPDADALLAELIEPAPAGVWPLEAFPHLRDTTERLQGVLGRAAAEGAVGINLLFYGPPGTGKTELARALAQASGLCAYQVRSSDDDGDGLNREGRLSAYQLAQRLLARRRGAMLIFDEVEDVFEMSDPLFSWMRGRGATGRQKGWMNRILEENPVPAIWVTNATDCFDPAFLRRFLLPVAFVQPPRSVRRQMVESHLGECAVPPSLLDELADDAALAPAQLGSARRLWELLPEAPPEETIRAGVAALRTLLHGSPSPRRRRAATRFDAAFLNLAGGVSPGAIVRALSQHGHGSLCFYGPPGTGKTAFAEILAEALDRELVARQASDLLSPFVGETERNLARLFLECDPSQSVLLLDEVDSFLTDRRQAQRSWERTQVNELLQQMERYPGIFIAATNLMSGIDAAALRRFDFKLHFRALTPAQRLALFAREAFGDATAPVPADLIYALEGLQGLTPGDFSAVTRQCTLLGERLAPEQFLRRLAAECRLKRTEPLEEA
ncbi:MULTISPECIES: AAA family ATPase [unclassified Methylococcus]|jgi:transitional endoplasmic reticulum ATPase|uniref:AAA family ATPase n=2 Tax=Methylococcaceae TaxID=403 RepID=UPI003D7E97EB